MPDNQDGGMVSVMLPAVMAEKISELRKNGGEVFQVMVRLGYDFAFVEEDGKVNWDDDHHG